MNAMVKKELSPAAAAVKSRKFREREHRFTKMTVADLITIRMSDLDIKNTDLAAALDYPVANVISMMKSGSMRLPESKIVAAADKLQIDRAMLLRKVLNENNPRLWDVIDKILGPKLISANEIALLNLVRENLEGHDIDLTDKPEFVQVVSSTIKEIVTKEANVADASLVRIRTRAPKSKAS